MSVSRRVKQRRSLSLSPVNDAKFAAYVNVPFDRDFYKDYLFRGETFSATTTTQEPYENLTKIGFPMTTEDYSNIGEITATFVDIREARDSVWDLEYRADLAPELVDESARHFLVKLNGIATVTA